MYKIKPILLLFLLVLCEANLIAHWVPDKKAFNIRSSFRNGEYDKSFRLCNKTISGFENGRSNNIFCYLEALDFKIKNKLEIAARIEETTSTLEKLITTSQSLDTEQKSFEILALAKVSATYSMYGFFKRAKLLLDESLTLYKTHTPTQIKSALDYYTVITWNRCGYHEDASKLAENSLNSMMSYFDSTYSLKSPRQSINGIYEGKFLIEQKRNTADFLNEYALSLHNKGSYIKADSLIQHSYRWIKTNIDPRSRDVSAFDNRMLKIKNLESLEKSSLAYDLATKKTQDGIDGILTPLDKTFKGYSYLETSEQYMGYEKILARYYWQSGVLNTGKRSTADGFYHKHRSCYKRMGTNRKNVNIIKAELLKLDKYIITNQPENAVPLLDTLIKKKNRAKSGIFLPNNHPNKRLLLLKSLEIYTILGLKKELIHTIKQLEKVDKVLFNEDSPLYTRDKLYMAMIKSDVLDLNKEAGLTFGEILDNSNSTQLFPLNNEFSKYDNEYSRLLIRLGKFKKAEKRIAKAREFASQFRDKHEGNYVRQDLLLAELLLETSKINEAKEILSKDNKTGLYRAHVSKKSFENRETIDEYYRLSMRKNILYGRLREAEEDFDKIKTKQLEDHINFSPLYISTGDFKEAEEMLVDAKKKYKSTYGTGSRRLLPALNYLSNINAQTGNYSKASNLEALALTRNLFGTNSWQYADALFVEGESYAILGDYRSAILELKQALNIYKSVYGEKHIKYASTLSELSLAKLYSGKSTQSTELDLLKASSTVREIMGANTVLHASILQNLAFYYLEINNIDLAEQHLQEAIEALNVLGSSNYKLKLAQIYRVKGKIQQYNKEFKDSESSFKKSLDYFSEIFNNKEHLEIVQTQSSMAQLYYVQGERKDSKKTLKKTTETYLDYINKYFNFLTEREKKEFWKKIKTDFEFYNTIAFENNDPKEIETVYNNTLNTKALLLNSSKQLRKAIYSSKDASVKKLFELWSAKQETLIKALSSNNEELQKQGINISLLQKEVDQLEKKLGEKSNAFSQKKREKFITWKDVRDQLRPDEFAIEIIRYRHFENGFTNNIKYKALIVGNGYESPRVVDLTNGNELDKRYLSFYRNSTKFKTNDPYSYNAYFKPIHDVIGDNKKIYISLDGVFNLINLETLRTPDGLFMIDKNEIITVTNTKDLITRQTNSSFINKNILLIGNPLYYQANLSSPEHDNMDGSQKWSQLPGTEKEANAINTKFKSSNWNTTLYTWDNASESVVKSIGKVQDSIYSYLHISTHGFFKPEQQQTLSSELDNRRGLDDPYLRSGLLFKNGGDIIDNNTVLNYNVSDGVLTAKEVANLDLENMETVVLSACETGLGKVSSGEGVYGLQRAFQSAGAKSVIISLFKVDDEVTNLLMQLMTEKYLETGNKREALTYAKKEVRKKYPDPIFWGSFVMSE